MTHSMRTRFAPRLRIHALVLMGILAVTTFTASALFAQGALVRKPAQELFEYLTKKSGSEAAQELAEIGGREGIEVLLKRASAEGGEELVERVTRYGTEYGASALRAIDSSPATMVRALDGLPPAMVRPAIGAVARDPARMTRLVGSFGKEALEAEVRHPGVGAKMVEVLADDGVRLAGNVSTDQAIVLVRHADEIAALPVAQKRSVVDAIMQTPKAVVELLERNPKFTITAATAGTVIAVGTTAMQPSVEIETLPDGTVIERRRSATDVATERFQEPASDVVRQIGLVLAIALGAWLGVRIWGSWRKQRLATKER